MNPALDDLAQLACLRDPVATTGSREPVEFRHQAEITGATVVDRASVITTHLAEVVRRNAGRLVSRQDVKLLVDMVKQSDPVVIDELNGALPPLASFVLPGGSPAAAALHLARTVARRAERDAVRLAESGETVSGPAMRYLNRLSDFLFVAARFANDRGAAEVFWKSGATR